MSIYWFIPLSTSQVSNNDCGNKEGEVIVPLEREDWRMCFASEHVKHILRARVRESSLSQRY
jgi:hypothetical protein